MSPSHLSLSLLTTLLLREQMRKYGNQNKHQATKEPADVNKYRSAAISGSISTSPVMLYTLWLLSGKIVLKILIVFV